MRPRVSLTLAAAAALVIAICELESVAAVNRWDPSDIGRAAGMSSYLLPEELSDEEHALITVRVEAGGDVRTYRYWLDPDEEVIDEMVTAEEIEAGAEATAMDGEPDPEIAAAVP